MENELIKYRTLDKNEFRKVFANWNNEQNDTLADALYDKYKDEINDKLYRLIENFVTLHHRSKMEKDNLIEYLTQTIVALSEANGYNRFDIADEINKNLEANY